jgi:hypothetical protein
VIRVSIADKDSFVSFDPVVENKLQFRGLNLTQKHNECLKRLIDSIEYTNCKRCFDVDEKPEVDDAKSGLHGG